MRRPKFALLPLFACFARSGAMAPCATRANVEQGNYHGRLNPSKAPADMTPMSSLRFGREREAMPDVSKQMIGYYTEGNYGLLPTRWRDQLAEIRALPPRQGAWSHEHRVTLRHVVIDAVRRVLGRFRRDGR
jgi:hypothetical protein